MRDLDLIVIGDRSCGTTRTYLTYLNDQGMRPRELWLVDFFPAPAKASKLRTLPLVGTTLAHRAHARAPKPEFQPSDEFFRLCARLQDVVPHAIDYAAPFAYEGYVGRIRELVAEDYDDPWLQREIVRHKDSAFLFTNGGIVPGELLGRRDVRIIHIHPGVVPEIRGSDCFLWSCHVRGRPGASCFYMAAGIDEGEVIGTMEFCLPDLSCIAEYLTPELEDMAYRALAVALDPHMRAMLFADVLARTQRSDLRKLDAVPQPPNDEPAFLWMHPKVRLKVLRDLVAASASMPGAKLEPLRP